ncbi:transcriptional regulator [Paraburkholderia dipogonis]|uniref:Transcriptional regulator n=1 Tax=Paraburkholderia dipogonis TaxID=1211383 RepID=A0A4Y8MX08_9BURK|nr:helix-turn-helix domain-containing protein [Paraburkholderia dipogonis]TFE41915.1 transcriptional regulator [Paraburkholderia dipogonis]
MRTPRIPDPRICSIDAALKIIGEKWTLLAIREISVGERRFDDIVFNTGAPRDILASRLKSLETAGVIRKITYTEKPVRYEYQLSEAGEQLFVVLEAIREWGDRFARTDSENIVNFYHSCGAKLETVLRCEECGEIINAHNVHRDRDVHRSEVLTDENSKRSR